MNTWDFDLKTLERFASERGLTERISNLEHSLRMKDSQAIADILAKERLGPSVLQAAMRVKTVAAQIHVIIHAVGLLISLPHVLEPGEQILSLSLGAGNTGREFDLETNKRVAEFTFIQWRGGPEAIRQNNLFIDLFNLVKHESIRKRCLYVLGKKEPLRFLNNNRSIRSVLSKNIAVRDDFHETYGGKYSVVSQFYNDVKNLVEIIDLREFVPALKDV